MAPGQTSGNSYDPEQAGILLDRLAGELVRASLKNPRALPDLRRDARELLICLDPWLTDQASAVSAAAHDVARGGNVSVLAEHLEELASILLDLAERDVPDSEATGA